MKSSNKAGKAWLALATVLFVTAGASPSWGVATNTPTETGCYSTLAKSLGKHTSAVTKAMAACQNDVLDGTIPGPCPDVTAQAAIDKSAASIAKSVPKKCQSTCSVSGVSCVDSDSCPPNGKLKENCTAGAKSIFFEASNMGYPGPFCEGILNGDLTEPEDFATCMGGVGSLVALAILDNTYGEIASPPSSDAAACLSAIVKSAPKSASKIATAVAKCRNTQLGADVALILPDDCATGDAKTAATITSTVQKFKDAIAKKCTNSSVATLDLCGAGVGGTLTVLAAQTCLGDMLAQVAYSIEDAETREYSGISIINGAYPSTAAARCGDNVVNQGPSSFLLNGEECDGIDDTDCPGECLPPGDTFQCTCGNIRRGRAFAYGLEADLDNGWSGASHNTRVTDGAGFVAEVANCDCAQFDPVDKATCLPGQSIDPICNVSANLAPRCSNRIGDGSTCDGVGNSNGASTDSDCRSCDADAENAGDFCTGSARTCVGGANTGDRCNVAGDCPGGACTGVGQCLDGPFAGNGCIASQNCGICILGTNAGNTCATNGNCPGGTCEVHACANKSCMGGANQDAPCSADAQCTGGRCAETSDCTAQCFDANDVATGPCAAQEDCAEGERCRGACDSSNTCIILRNGAPLPISSKGTSVCLDSQFHTNMVGTRNIQTGAHDINYELRSLVILSTEIQARPCPVCGGWCADNSPVELLDRSRCEGSCAGGTELACRVGPSKGSACVTDSDCGDKGDGSFFSCTNLACRFQDDCPSGTCSGTASPECGGDDCRLDLSCGGGPNHGQPCRIEAATAFGTTSADCPPDPASNQSGAGLAILWTPLTSGVVTNKNPGACDASGYQNYDCNCVTGGGGTRTRPNDCNPACTDPDPAYYGDACSQLTTCVGGLENGRACDEDSDCTGGTCSRNPKVCGDGSTGTCSLARCVGGANDNDICSQDNACPGGACVRPDCIVGGAPCADGFCRPQDCSLQCDGGGRDGQTCYASNLTECPNGCVGGTRDGEACTSDANCPGGTCTDPGGVCAEATCDGGATCDDSCPAGVCASLCLDRGHCDAGPKVGLFCALDQDCPGGACVAEASDLHEGACASGTFEHCDGNGWQFISCSSLDVDTPTGCEAGVNGIIGDTDDNIGAGFCRADIKNCFVNDGYAEGGTTLNGRGDPTNTFSVATYCVPASLSSAVNSTAGLPGPGRIRQAALNVTNYTQLP